MTDAEHALSLCRQIGFQEGEWIRDVRAGCCQITTLTASVVIVACENGQALALDGATELLESNRNDDIQLGECE